MAASSSMDRITQWVSSQEVVSTDLTVRIADSVFPLHKAVMVPKCGYIRRAVAAAASQQQGPVAGAMELDLSALPGGADAFEKLARYCYGGILELTASDVAPLRCAAAFLDAPDLARRADDFLAQTALRSLPGAVAVLRSCELLVPGAADELGVARRAADAVALGLCNEALFPTATREQPGWWWAANEPAALSPASFKRVLTALRCRRAAPDVVAAAAVAYAERVLAGVLTSPGSRDAAVVVRADEEQRALLEDVVDALPPAGDAPLPAMFLCRLLHAAVTAEASATTCRDMELRVAAVLDQATPADLLAVALDAAGERVTNADTVRRVVAAFVQRHQRQSQQTQEGRYRRPSMAGEPDVGALEKVARTVDEVAAEMATESTLAISKFVGVAGAVPKDARPSHDRLYRAVDVYLKTHPGLDEIEREKVCSVMDPLKLSYQARLHAAQNKRLPLQAVLTALYYDQLKLRSGEGGGWETTTTAEEAAAAAGKARAEAAMARENEALRSELARMRAYVSGMQQQQQSKGSGSRSAAVVVTPAAGKKASFLGSVSRTLSRLNPFKGGGWAKDTASIADGRDTSDADAMHVVKPKRRRFSIG